MAANSVRVCVLFAILGLFPLFCLQTRAPKKEENDASAPNRQEEFKIPVYTTTTTTTIKKTLNQTKSNIAPKPIARPYEQTSKNSEKIFNGRILYHFKCQSATRPLLCSLNTRLNELPSAHLTGLKAGTIFPAFITELDEISPFELLMGYHNGVLQMFIRGESNEVIKQLEKLLIMWITRHDEEKWLMVATATLPRSRDRLTKILQDRYELSKSSWSSDDQQLMETHMKDVRRLTGLVKETYNNFPADKPPEVERVLRGVEKSLIDLKWKIVLCLYHCLWVATAKETLNEFKMLMNRLKQLKSDEVPVLIYLKIVSHCNEVFVGHMSEHIIEAAKKCIQCMRRRKSQQRLDSNNFKANKNAYMDDEKGKMNEILNKIVSQRNWFQRSEKMDGKQCRKQYYIIYNLLIQLPEHVALIRCLERYKKYVDKKDILPKNEFLSTLRYICGMLRTKLGLSKDWKREKIEEIDRKFKVKCLFYLFIFFLFYYLKFLSLWFQLLDPGPSKDSKPPVDDEIIEIPVIKPKIEELTLSDSDEDAKCTKINKPNDHAMTLKLGNNPGVSENDDNEDKMLLQNLDTLEELLNDPTLSGDF